MNPVPYWKKVIGWLLASNQFDFTSFVTKCLNSRYMSIMPSICLKPFFFPEPENTLFNFPHILLYSSPPSFRIDPSNHVLMVVYSVRSFFPLGLIKTPFLTPITWNPICILWYVSARWISWHETSGNATWCVINLNYLAFPYFFDGHSVIFELILRSRLTFNTTTT